MSNAKDTLPRLVTMLCLIPPAPATTTSSVLQEKLKERGFEVDLRSIQRDLQKLSATFPLVCSQQSPRRWSLVGDASLALPKMNPATALALCLAEEHLNALLPKSVSDQLAPQFRNARRYLDSQEGNEMTHWARRVRSLPNGKALRPAQVEARIWSDVSQALLQRRQLQVAYLSRSKGELGHLRLHPAGLVSRHAITYLIASVDGYDDLRQFALHRLREVECLDLAARPHDDFDIDRYTRGGGFNSPGPVGQVELVADVSPQIAWLLGETPLGDDQHLTPLPGSDWYRLRARVPDDQETQWWVFGLGENARIHAPPAWADALRQRLARLAALYAPAAGPDATAAARRHQEPAEPT